MFPFEMSISCEFLAKYRNSQYDYAYKQNKHDKNWRSLPWKLTDFFVLVGVTSLRSLPPLSGSSDVLPRSESRDPTELLELTEPAFPADEQWRY